MTEQQKQNQAYLLGDEAKKDHEAFRRVNGRGAPQRSHEAWKHANNEALLAGNVSIQATRKEDLKPRVLEWFDPRYIKALKEGNKELAAEYEAYYSALEDGVIKGFFVDGVGGLAELTYQIVTDPKGSAAALVSAIGQIPEALAELPDLPAHLSAQFEALGKLPPEEQAEAVGRMLGNVGFALVPIKGGQYVLKAAKMGGREKIVRSLTNPNTLRGAKISEVNKLIPKGWEKMPLKKGKGVRYVNPEKPGESILIEHGWKNAKDLVHSGPYVRIARDGKIIRIPLSGNPAL